MPIVLGLLDSVRTQRIYGIDNQARKSYRTARNLGICAYDARLMVIGSCTMSKGHSREWVCRSAPDGRTPPWIEGRTDD